MNIAVEDKNAIVFNGTINNPGGAPNNNLVFKITFSGFLPKPEGEILKPTESKTFELFTTKEALLDPNKNFINKNFKADSLPGNQYRKNYRLHQLYENAI